VAPAPIRSYARTDQESLGSLHAGQAVRRPVVEAELLGGLAGKLAERAYDRLAGPLRRELNEVAHLGRDLAARARKPLSRASCGP
jgi:hypothetical protein